MKKRRISLILGISLLLTACGSVQESPAEELVVLTESAETAAETTSTAPPETAPETDAPTEPETESDTATEPETTEADEPSDKPPQLLLRNNCLVVEMGDTRDLSELLSFGDDHDPHPTMTWEGTYDANEPGEYPVTVTLLDSAGNSARYDIIVGVPWEKIGVKVSFDLFLSKNPGRSCGIDVSKWQGTIDFDAVKQAGADFVLMRIGYGEGAGELDPCFSQNFEGAKAAGLQRGVYFYSTAATPDAARRQADWIAANLDGEALDLPVAYDWENFRHFQDWGMSFDTLNAIYDAFSEQMASYGYTTMLYAEPQTLGTAWDTAGKTIWLADYGVDTDYEGAYYLRQAWNTGRIDGIDGDVDFNVLHGSD